jgi:MtfA peptidase
MNELLTIYLGYYRYSGKPISLQEFLLIFLMAAGPACLLLIGINFYTRKRKRKLAADEKSKLDLILSKFHYYQLLSNEDKSIFMERVVMFREDKVFDGLQGIHLDAEKEYIISAAAVQLTFGLENYLMENVLKILIFPDSFYLKNYREPFDSLSTSGGILYLSWRHLAIGNANLHDGFNIGLYEFSHCLRFNVFADHRYTFDEQFAERLKHWYREVYPVFVNTKLPANSVLSLDAKENANEFFACCVQVFFETPVLFDQQFPDIFSEMCRLLNQHPLFPGKGHRSVGNAAKGPFSHPGIENRELN